MDKDDVVEDNGVVTVLILSHSLSIYMYVWYDYKIICCIVSQQTLEYNPICFGVARCSTLATTTDNKIIQIAFTVQYNVRTVPYDRDSIFQFRNDRNSIILP